MTDRAVVLPRLVQGIGAFAERYDGFVIDQWGVMHDGKNAYPDAVDCIERLVALGKVIVVVTNSGKRVTSNVERLSAMGFAKDTYHAIVSSGEVAWKNLATRRDPFYRQLGKRCLLISSDGDHSVVDGLGIEVVDAIERAEFIMLAGVDDARPSTFYDDWLNDGSRRDVPLICANPDMVRIVNGVLLPGCGALAHRYEGTGGTVHYVGKPFPDIYNACREIFAQSRASRIVAIGDSLKHDVAGGTEAGFDTVFVMNGIHWSDFADSSDDEIRLERLVRLAFEEDVMPDWVVPWLSW